jgi:RHH-type rel operon transcriptional repressor/antitoxin RelB
MYIKGVFDMIAVRLDKDIENRLARLAKRTGRTKTFYVREAILEHIEDLEDAYIAEKRLKKPGLTYTLDEVEKELGLEN